MEGLLSDDGPAAAGGAPRRFLMVCMQYPTGAGESYLTTELGDALVAAGHDVEVLLLNWSAPLGAAPREYRAPSGIRIVECAPGPWQGSARSSATPASSC